MPLPPRATRCVRIGDRAVWPVACAFTAALSAAGAAAASGQTTGPADLAAEARRLAKHHSDRLGEGYQTRIDFARHLVYVSALDAGTSRRVVAELARHADAHRKLLFGSPLRHNVVILLPSLADYRRIVPAKSVFGFYNPRRRALATVTLSSVLTHEFVHALHHNDQLIAGQHHAIWVVEGLATLFQWVEIADGRPEPRPGPMLRKLQQDLREGRALGLPRLCRTSRKQFVEAAKITYPQARWVMMYLHVKGKLEGFYRRYKAGHGEDPTGLKALEACLDMSVAQIEADWHRWLLARQPPWRPARAARAHLGVRMAPAEGGVKVTGFARGSAAARAGKLRVGDIVLSVAGRPTPSAGELADAVGACRPGQTVEIEVIRGGRTDRFKHLLGAVRGR